MKTATTKKKSINQIFGEYPAYIDKLRDENKRLREANDAMLNALKSIAECEGCKLDASDAKGFIKIALEAIKNITL